MQPYTLPNPVGRLPRADALTATTLLCAAGSLAAQTASTKPVTEKAADAPTTDMQEVVVEAQGQVYNPSRLQSPKYTEPVRNIPQTITVIPQTVIEDRGAFSLRDVLRNTPGISMQAGEGGGGLPGDSLSIRGFSSRSDFFLDGMRDFGAYNRDPFNTEQVEVAKGPSSTTGGRGTTGGSINMASKMANLTPSNLSTVSYGSSNLYRATVDVNEPLGEHAAFRLNGMFHHADTPGRDEVGQERYGIASSLAFGLGTDTRFTLNYQRLEENNIPDYGIPWIPTNNTLPWTGGGAGLGSYANLPAPVSYDTWYGLRGVDYEHVQNDTFTGIFEHDFSESLRLRNLTRYSRTHRDSLYTAPRFRDLAAGGAVQYSDALNRQMQRRQMTSEVFANQTNVTAEFDTSVLKHTLVAGLEFYWERQLNANAAGIASVTNIFDSSVDNPPSGVPATGDIAPGTIPGLPGAAEAHLDTIAIYLFDTVKIGRHWEVSGGLRYDHMQAEARGANGAPGFANSDDLFSWKLGLVFKPVDYGSVYFGYGTSFNPTIDGAVSTGLGNTAATAALDPEESRSYELGTKWDLFDERLSLSFALFRSEKSNARTTDAAGLVSLAGNQIVQGYEVGASGNLTKNWQIFAGYAYMQSETEASSNANEVGQALSNAPEHSFNLWTTYNLLESLQVGFGAQFVGDRTNGTPNAAGTSIPRTAPDYWTLDAMLNYKVNEKLSFRLNIYNLADERYIDRVGGGHFVPGAGRSAALTATVKF